MGCTQSSSAASHEKKKRGKTRPKKKTTFAESAGSRDGPQPGARAKSGAKGQRSYVDAAAAARGDSAGTVDTTVHDFTALGGNNGGNGDRRRSSTKRKKAESRKKSATLVAAEKKPKKNRIWEGLALQRRAESPATSLGGNPLAAPYSEGLAWSDADISSRKSSVARTGSAARTSSGAHSGPQLSGGIVRARSREPGAITPVIVEAPATLGITPVIVEAPATLGIARGLADTLLELEAEEERRKSSVSAVTTVVSRSGSTVFEIKANHMSKKMVVAFKAALPALRHWIDTSYQGGGATGPLDDPHALAADDGDASSVIRARATSLADSESNVVMPALVAAAAGGVGNAVPAADMYRQCVTGGASSPAEWRRLEGRKAARRAVAPPVLGRRSASTADALPSASDSLLRLAPSGSDSFEHSLVRNYSSMVQQDVELRGVGKS
jgi:hypothetical protein